MDGLGSREAPEGQVLAPTAHCSKHRKVQAGATLSYTDNGDGTITDNNTGLMWEKKTGVVRVPLGSDVNVADLHDVMNRYRWSWDGSQETIWDWLDDVNAEGGTGFAGHNDWRIPNRKELESIVDYSQPYPEPKISPAFGPTLSNTYTTSTTETSLLFNMWVIDFTLVNVWAGHKYSREYVRAVRGGL